MNYYRKPEKAKPMTANNIIISCGQDNIVLLSAGGQVVTLHVFERAVRGDPKCTKRFYLWDRPELAELYTHMLGWNLKLLMTLLEGEKLL